MIHHPAPRAVLFDFDFTLGDSSVAIIECVNCALLTLGRPSAPAHEIRRRIGLTLPDVLRSFDAACGPEDVSCFVDAFHRRADEVMEPATQIYPHAISYVQQLRTGGVHTGIVSTKVRYRIESILSRRGLSHLFDVIIGFEDVTEPKPDPAGLLLALDRLNVEPRHSLYIGDHEVDVEAARRAGVPFLGVLTGLTTGEAFQRLGARCIADLSTLTPTAGASTGNPAA